MHELALYGVVLAAALGESTAFVGLLVPGVGVLLAAAVMAARGEASLAWLGAVAAAGGVIGFGASYHLGRAGSRWSARWGSRAAAPLERAGRLVARLGGWAVFWGHFFGPVRAFVAFAAGVGGLPPRPFWVASVLGAVAWGYGLAAAGAAVSGGWSLVEARLGRGSVLLALVAALLYLALRVVAGAMELGLRLLPSATRPLAALAARSSGSAPRAAAGRWLARRLAAHRATGLLLTVGALACAGFAWLFFGVVEDLLFHDPLVRVDEHVFSLLQALRTPAGDRLFLALSCVAAGPVLAASVAAGAAALATLARRFEAALLAAGFGAGEALVWVLKLSWGRPRPAPALAMGPVSGAAFPSNHAFSSLVLFGLLAYFAGKGLRSPTKRGHLFAGVGVLVVAVGLSRLYLGAHWLSDVLGGYALGGIWLTALVTAAAIRDPGGREAPTRRGVAAALAAAAVVALAWGATAAWRLAALPPDRPFAATGRPMPLSRLTEELPGLASLAVEDLPGRPVGRPGLLLLCPAQRLPEAAQAAGWPPAEGLRAGAVLPQLLHTFRGEPNPLGAPYPFFWRSRPQDVALVSPTRTGRAVARLWQTDLSLEDGAPLWVAWIEEEPAASRFLGVPLPPIAPGPTLDPSPLAAALVAAGGFREVPGSPVRLLRFQEPP